MRFVVVLTLVLLVDLAAVDQDVSAWDLVSRSAAVVAVEVRQVVEQPSMTAAADYEMKDVASGIAVE
jgi:hypothetical protein